MLSNPNRVENVVSQWSLSYFDDVHFSCRVNEVSCCNKLQMHVETDFMTSTVEIVWNAEVKACSRHSDEIMNVAMHMTCYKAKVEVVILCSSDDEQKKRVFFFCLFSPPYFMYSVFAIHRVLFLFVPFSLTSFLSIFSCILYRPPSFTLILLWNYHYSVEM